MITTTIKQLPKSSAELEIKISWDEIKETYQKIFDEVAKSTIVEGFRKGKAPKDLVEKKVNKTKVYEEVVKDIVPKAYSKAVSDNKLVPVTSPKIEVLKAKEGEEWMLKATIALRPKIDLKNYKDKIKELKKGKVKIWTPGQKEAKKDDGKPSIDELINTILQEVDIELPELLVTEEANRLLSNLIDQTQKLGLSVEQYLMSKGKTTEQIRAEYAIQAAKNLTIEFALAEIADKESITVTPKDLEDLISKIENPTERENLKKDSYYLAHLLRQQKTLDYLNSL